MHVLVLGGTQFVGRHIVEAFLAGGHAVTILTRGRTADPLPSTVERLRGDRDAGEAGLAALAGRTWDACIDLSGFTPRQVGPSVDRLVDAVRRYVFVSAVRVYGDPTDRPVGEEHPRLPPAGPEVATIDDQTYGPLKVACEDLVLEMFGERATILRPQAVLGPHDPVDRLSYWVRRAAQGGPTLAPGDGSDHLQFIAVDDAARFVRTVVEHDLGGAFNLAGPRLAWSEFIELLGILEPIWVDAATLARADLAIGELPLYRPEHGPLAGLMDIRNDRARAAGLVVGEPRVTIESVRRWIGSCPLAPALSPQREAALLRAAKA